MALGVIRDLREHRTPTGEEELAAFETDILAGFVLARASAGLTDSTIRNDANHLELIRDWFGRPLWEMKPEDGDDDLDLANRRITLAGRRQRLGDLSHRALRRWLCHRRTTWPHTNNPHVLISAKTAHGTGPISQPFVTLRMNHTGCSVDRIRKDRILHEALTAGPDPLHLSLVFGISHSTAARYTAIAEHLLADELDQAPEQ